MEKLTIERENIEMGNEGTMTSASAGLISLLPLVAATSLGTTSAVDLHKYPDGKYNLSPQVNVEYHPSAQLQISEGVDESINSTDNLTQELLININDNVKYTNTEELEILEGFIGDILDNSEQQPSKLKSLMYDNIDDLLI